MTTEETESNVKTVKSKSIKTKYIKAMIDRTQETRKFRLSRYSDKSYYNEQIWQINQERLQE